MKIITKNFGFALDVTRGNFGIDVEDHLPPEMCENWYLNSLTLSTE